MLGALVIALARRCQPALVDEGQEQRASPRRRRRLPAPAPAEATPEPAATAPPPPPPRRRRTSQPGQKPKLAHARAWAARPEEQKQLDDLQAMPPELRGRVARLQARGPAAGGEEVRGEAQHARRPATRRPSATWRCSERKERLDAIAQFEEFLQRYPDEPRYTPDVMFRLAELYYERSADDHIGGHARLRGAAQALDPSSNAAPPPEPTVDFAPVHRPLPAADRRASRTTSSTTRPTYLLGYCLEKQNDFEERRSTPTSELIARYPKSQFATEAWVRIGEYYFDAYDDPDALAQGRRGLRARHQGHRRTRSTTRRSTSWAGPTTAWTASTTRCDRFLALVDYYEAAGQEEGRRGGGGDLRDEALQYTAISFADEKWGSARQGPGDLREAGRPPLRGRGLPAHGRRLLRPDQAHRGHRGLPAGAAEGPARPRTRRRSSRRSSRPTSATGSWTRPSPSRETLANAYGPGTPWYEKHKRDPDVHRRRAGARREEPLRAAPSTTTSRRWCSSRRASSSRRKATFEAAAKALRRLPGALPAQQERLRDAVLSTPSASTTRSSSPQAAKHYDAVRDSGAGRQVPAGRGLRRGARLAEAGRADIKAEEAAGATRCSGVNRPARGREAAAHRRSPTRGAALVAASDAYVPAARPTDEKRARHRLQGRRAVLRAQRLPRGAQALRGHRPARTRRTRSAKYATNLIVETFLIDKDWRSVEEVVGAAGPEQGRHRPEERAVQGPGQVQARRPLQAGRRADGRRATATRRRRSTSSWWTRSRSTSSPTRR